MLVNIQIKTQPWLKLIEVTEKLQNINLMQAKTVVKIQVKENPFQNLKNWAIFSRTGITKISNYIEISRLVGQTQQILISSESVNISPTSDLETSLPNTTPKSSFTSVRASASQPKAATANAALLCTWLLVERSGPTRALMMPWLWILTRDASCRDRFVSTAMALEMAPSLWAFKVFITGTIPSDSAITLAKCKRGKIFVILGPFFSS